MADFAKTKPLYYDATQKVHRSMSEGQVVDPALLPISTDDGNELKFGTDGGMYVKGTTASDMVSAETPNFIQMDREGKLKVDGNSVLSNGGINLLTIDSVDGKITLTKENLEGVIHVVSADKDNLISAGSDGGAYLSADGIINADDPVLYANEDGKVSTSISIEYNPGNGQLSLIGKDDKVIGSAVVPSQTSALNGVYLLNGKPSNTGATTAGDYHFSVQYSTDGGSSWDDPVPATVTATKGMEAAGKLPGESSSVNKVRAFFNGQKAEAPVSSGKAALQFADGTKLDVIPGVSETTYSFTPGVGIETGVYLDFVFLLSDGTVADVYVDLTTLSDVYTAGNGISIGSGDTPTITAVASPNGGVLVDSTGIKLDTAWLEENIEVPVATVIAGNGIDVQGSEESSTVSVKPKTNGGIAVGTDGVSVSLSPDGGLETDATGLHVDADWLSTNAPAPEAGNGINVSGRVVSAVAKPNGGIAVDASGISANITAEGGLAVDGTGIHVDESWLAEHAPSPTAGNGINISDSVVSAVAKPEGGIAVDESGISVTPTVDGGIVVDGTGVHVDEEWLAEHAPAPVAGDGINVSGSTISAKAKPNGGIAVDSTGISVSVAPDGGLVADDTGLHVDDDWLTGKIPTYTGSDGVTVSGTSITADATVVRTTGDQTIDGNKTFSQVVKGKTPDAGASSTELVTAEWIRANLASLIQDILSADEGNALTVEDGKLKVIVVSADAGNLLVSGTDKGAYTPYDYGTLE